uniref:U8 snoRNA-decapping enzyme n=1 Tax=Strigamia maritima TaxID=126957 RepID=T1J0H0_STRMM
MAGTSSANNHDTTDNLKFEFIHFDEFKDFIPMTFYESLTFNEFKHAAHCMIYAMWSTKILKKYNPRAAVLMILREDGHFGFPGGTVDDKEHVIVALNRELAEEIGLDANKHVIAEENHVISQVNHQMKFVTHFFALEVTFEEFRKIEKYCLNARDYGIEVLGILRASLYTMNNNYDGFPAFLRNNFVGNCKQQLCIGLLSRHILNLEEIEASLLCNID